MVTSATSGFATAKSALQVSRAPHIQAVIKLALALRARDHQQISDPQEYSPPRRRKGSFPGLSLTIRPSYSTSLSPFGSYPPPTSSSLPSLLFSFLSLPSSWTKLFPLVRNAYTPLYVCPNHPPWPLSYLFPGVAAAADVAACVIE